MVHANRMDGAWWPRCSDLIQELPPVLQAVSQRIGRIRGVLLNQGEWLPAPVDWTPVGNHRVRIGWYGNQDAHMVVLIGDSAKRVDLLVIPPESERSCAAAAMTIASAMGNVLSAPEALLAAGLSEAQPARESGVLNATLGS